jgi:hypothetical protein
VTVSIKRDATKPTSNGTPSPAANAAGWNNIDVSVSFKCDDNLSGVASCGPAQTVAAEGAGHSATGTAVDNAGNSETTTVSDINIDKTAPGIDWSGGLMDKGEYYFGSVPAAPTCTATDSLSGPDGCTVGGYSGTVGTHWLTATATDVAGNQTVEHHSYTVLAWRLRGFYPADGHGRRREHRQERRHSAAQVRGLRGRYRVDEPLWGVKTRFASREVRSAGGKVRFGPQVSKPLTRSENTRFQGGTESLEPLRSRPGE